MRLIASTYSSVSQGNDNIDQAATIEGLQSKAPPQNPRLHLKGHPICTEVAVLGPGQSQRGLAMLTSPRAQRAFIPGPGQTHILLGANLPAFPGLESEHLGLTSDAASFWSCDQVT